MKGINLWAVLVAGALNLFVLGGAWYKLFGIAYQRASGSAAAKDMEGGHSAPVFVVTLGFSIAAALAFAVWLGPNPSLESALKAGALAGLGIAATSFGINYQFAGRSFTLWLIDAGYHTAQFLMYGLIL